MKRIIWLDDIRDPCADKWHNLIVYLTDIHIDVTWVKSYKEFVREIEGNSELPYAIFFDHDLGQKKSGMDCMKWFIEYMQDNKINPHHIKAFFQSVNPVGVENMSLLLESYRRFYDSI